MVGVRKALVLGAPGCFNNEQQQELGERSGNRRLKPGYCTWRYALLGMLLQVDRASRDYVAD